MMDDLLSGLRMPERVAPGALFLPGYAASIEREALRGIAAICALAPPHHLLTPGGRRLSVAMTGCGAFGWHSDRAGYRYVSRDPVSGRPWPAMPRSWRDLAREAAERAGYPGFEPQSCLVNRYDTGARMGLHRDCDEDDLTSPVVSVSFGVTAAFLFGGAERHDPVRKLAVESGDVLVWGGPSRLAYHGVAPLPRRTHSLTGPLRWNLTFRRVTHRQGP
ncbi:DNA oxidative demethylase AlkB [Swaminathania salitolerans]|nr:DNA oxidative demethylase AlkB [Swaminathania salitolerans]GBQ12740.1 DNA repair protein for alkylated DNA [Swaminathania salitolerans LMG 21291]